jgi:WD40 repeat protein
VANTVAFSPDGALLSTGGDDGTARIWDVATQQQVGPSIFPTGNESESTVSTVAFSSDGKALAIATSDGVVRLWDISTRRQIGPSIPGIGTGNGGDTSQLIALSPSSGIMAAAGSDEVAHLWDISFPHDLKSAACAVAGISMTATQWNSIISTEPYQASC